MSTLVEIMRALRAMPPLPEVTSRVLELVRKPNCSIDMVVATMTDDRELTGRILSLCRRSAGADTSIGSVSDAVAFLGARNVVKLALVCSTESYFQDLPSNEYARPAELWRQALACATTCQNLAERCGHDQPMTAFTAGILHNIGRVAIVKVAPASTLAAAARELRDPDEDPLLSERRLFGLDHAAASGIVAETWGLPTELRRAARNHHDRAHLSADDDLTPLLHTGEQIVSNMAIGEPCAARPHEAQEPALRRLQLTAYDLEEVRDLALHEIERLTELLAARPLTSR